MARTMQVYRPPGEQAKPEPMLSPTTAEASVMASKSQRMSPHGVYQFFKLWGARRLFRDCLVGDLCVIESFLQEKGAIGPRPKDKSKKEELIERVYDGIWGKGSFRDPHDHEVIADEVIPSDAKDMWDSDSRPEYPTHWAKDERHIVSSQFASQSLVASCDITSVTRDVAAFVINTDMRRDAQFGSADLFLCVFDAKKDLPISTEEMERTCPLFIKYRTESLAIGKGTIEATDTELSTSWKCKGHPYHISLTKLIGDTPGNALYTRLSVFVNSVDWESKAEIRLYLLRNMAPSYSKNLTQRVYQQELPLDIAKTVSTLDGVVEAYKTHLLHHYDISSTSIKRKTVVAANEAAADDGIETGDVVIGLTDPLTLQRIVHPAKGKDCTHLAAFDLSTFIDFAMKSNHLECSICSKGLALHDLVIAKETFLGLQNFTNCESLVISPAGTITRKDISVTEAVSDRPSTSDTTGTTASAASSLIGGGTKGNRHDNRHRVVSVIEEDSEEEDAAPMAKRPRTHIPTYWRGGPFDRPRSSGTTAEEAILLD